MIAYHSEIRTHISFFKACVLGE